MRAHFLTRNTPKFFIRERAIAPRNHRAFSFFKNPLAQLKITFVIRYVMPSIFDRLFLGVAGPTKTTEGMKRKTSLVFRSFAEHRVAETQNDRPFAGCSERRSSLFKNIRRNILNSP